MGTDSNGDLGSFDGLPTFRIGVSLDNHVDWGDSNIVAKSY